MLKDIELIERELQQVEEALDNYYVQIRIHHERKEFRKAAAIFAKTSELQQRGILLSDKLGFYRTAKRLNDEGTLVTLVKRPKHIAR